VFLKDAPRRRFVATHPEAAPKRAALLKGRPLGADLGAGSGQAPGGNAGGPHAAS